MPGLRVSCNASFQTGGGVYNGGIGRKGGQTNGQSLVHTGRYQLVAGHHELAGAQEGVAAAIGRRAAYLPNDAGGAGR